MASYVEWHGQQVLDDVHHRLEGNMLALGQQVVAIAERYARKRTGRLATSIHFDFNREDLRLVFVVDTPYGMFVEYGTRNMRPQPYLRPALNAVGPIYGFETEMAFANMPEIHAPILAHGDTFKVPTSLTAKQLAHVKKHLMGASRRHHVGNVKRAKVKIRKFWWPR